MQFLLFSDILSMYPKAIDLNVEGQFVPLKFRQYL